MIGVRRSTRPDRSVGSQSLALLPYLLLGTGFGVLLVKSGAASWYRVQEMFHFASIHMYGLIGSAVLTGLLGTWALRRSGRRSLNGQAIHVTPKEGGWVRYVLGGLTFGTGWGLAGVCPGPILALLGSGVWSMLIVLVSALIGTWLYGALRRWLPH